MKSIGKTLAKHKPTLFFNISKAFGKNENALARPKSAIRNGHTLKWVVLWDAKILNYIITKVTTYLYTEMK